MAKTRKVRVTFECSPEFKRDLVRAVQAADSDMSKFIRHRIRAGMTVACARCGKTAAEISTSPLVHQSVQAEEQGF
jgi:hypothetical protein